MKIHEKTETAGENENAEKTREILLNDSLVRD